MKKHLNILLVDNDSDDHGFFNMALRKIKHIKHSVLSFFDGIELMEYLDVPKDKADYKPDVIFLDLHMPKMGGLPTLKKIKALEKYKDVPVYMLTSSSNLEDFRLCNIAGAFGFFTKGFSLEKFTKQLEGIIKELPRNKLF